MADVQELEQPIDGVETGAEESAAPSTTADAAATRQPEQKRVNLDEFPEFRQYKSAQDRRIAEMERRHQAAIAQMQQTQQQYEQSLVGNMEPEQRSAFEVQRERQRAEAAERRLAEIEVERTRLQVLQDVANKYKVPLEALEAAQDPGHARDLAWEWREKELERQAAESEEAKAQRQQKKAANKPDLGTGVPATPVSDWEREADKLKKNKDGPGYIRHILSARNK